MRILFPFLGAGTVILEPGWTKYDDYNKKDKILPNLEKGDIIDVNFTPKEKETSPPKHYTIETLNNYLKNPFKDEKSAAKEREAQEDGLEADDAADYKAIFEGLELGTEATRTGIIDNAKKSGYIELKKDVYHILPGGEFLIESLIQMQINMDKYKTSELGQALKKVYRGTISVGDSVKLAEAEIAEVFSKQAGSTPENDNDTGFYGDVVGICPLCGKELKRQRTFYGCSGYKEGCKFSVNLAICKRVISISLLQKLLSDGKTDVLEGFVSPKTGKSFDAILKLENGRIAFEFPPKASSAVQSDSSARPVAPVFGEAIPLPDEPPPGY